MNNNSIHNKLILILKKLGKTKKEKKKYYKNIDRAWKPLEKFYI